MNAELDLLSHTALKGSAVLLAALLAGLAVRRLASSRRYAIWMTAMLALAVLPFAMVSLPAWRVIPKSSRPPDWMVLEPQEVVEAVEMPVEASAVAEPVTQAMPVMAPQLPSEPVKPVWTWNEIIEWLPMVWLGVAVLMLIRLWWSAVRLGRLKQNLESSECAEIADVARELGLKRVPRLFVGAADAVPMVWGVKKPCLLLPRGFEAWSSEKRRGVLLHELAHLRRRDPLALWLAQAVKALHWFNPLAWLTLRQMRADQERACDDAVLRHGVRASDYAQALLDLSRHNRVAPGLALCALTITRCAPVESRVRAVLDAKCSRDALTLRWLAGMTALAMLLMLPVAMLHAIEGPKLRGRILDRHGVVLAETTTEKSRHYPLKALAAHVIGYTGKTKHDDPTPMGRSEIEKTQNDLLARGEDVKLTLDARIQSLTHRALLDAGYERGAAVILDPRSGEILAMVSLPDYDPNAFVPSISMQGWDRLAQDKNYPLLHRSVAEYAPGSAYKLLTGLAGIATGIGDKKFTCEGSVAYGGTTMQCWINRQDGGKHGELGMADALAASCSCFWYQFGNAAGIEQIGSMGRKVGLGTRYGIADDEREGVMPSPSWLSATRPGGKWSDGLTASTSIGQGMVLVTPLQMAVLAATVGNGGKVPQPVLIKQGHEPSPRADLIADGLSAAQIEQLREGMRLVVHGANGTGKAAQSDKVVIAGKTGTAQNWRRVGGQVIDDNNVWFIGFAPFDQPALAFAILKQGGKSGGGDCAPIAKRIVEETLALPADGSGEVKPVGDATGDAWEKAEAQRSAFDAKAAVISSAIRKAEPEAKTDFVLTELKIGHGAVTLHGTASDMFQALEFLGNLVKIGDQFEIQWASPGPKTIKDAKRVEFQARGIYRPAVKAEKGVTGQSEKLSTPDPSAQLKQMAASAWSAVSLGAALPDLPIGAVIQCPPPGSSSEGPKARGAFTAPREEALLWLQKSLRHESEQLHAWPTKPRPFKANYRIHKGEIIVSSQDGEIVHLYVLLDNPLPDLFRKKIMEAFKSADAKSDVQPEKSQNADIRQQSDAAIRMRPVDADNWKFLKSKGLLANLPARARPFDLGDRHPERQVKSVQTFHFLASREEVRRWLVESLRVKAGHEETFLNWPDPPKAFNRTYSAANDCQITAHCPDGGTVHVSISKPRPLILVAPDEATPPTPKTAAPKELKGVVSVDSQWPAPPAVLMNAPFPLHLYIEDTYREEQNELKAAMAQRDNINNRFNKALLTRISAR